MTNKKFKVMSDWFDEDLRLSKLIADADSEQLENLVKAIKVHNLKKKIISQME